MAQKVAFFAPDIQNSCITSTPSSSQASKNSGRSVSPPPHTRMRFRPIC